MNHISQQRLLDIRARLKAPDEREPGSDDDKPARSPVPTTSAGKPVRAFVFSDGLCEVFDVNGRHCKDLEGPYSDVQAAVARLQIPVYRP